MEEIPHDQASRLRQLDEMLARQEEIDVVFSDPELDVVSIITASPNSGDIESNEISETEKPSIQNVWRFY